MSRFDSDDLAERLLPELDEEAETDISSEGIASDYAALDRAQTEKLPHRSLV